MIKKLVKIHGRPKTCLILGISNATLQRYLKNGIPSCKKEKINERIKSSKNQENQ